MNRAILMTRPRYRRLMRELRRRGGGQRETGAFLLGTRGAPPIRRRVEVTDIVYYDDLDPTCLTGGITMHSSGMSALNAYCSAHKRIVLGDVHTHPHESVAQSIIDSTHPMFALSGHLAFIVPRYAARPHHLHDLGGHRLHRDGSWDAHTGKDVRQLLTIRTAPTVWIDKFSQRLWKGIAS